MTEAAGARGEGSSQLASAGVEDDGKLLHESPEAMLVDSQPLWETRVRKSSAGTGQRRRIVRGSSSGSSGSSARRESELGMQEEQANGDAGYFAGRKSSTASPGLVSQRPDVKGKGRAVDLDRHRQTSTEAVSDNDNEVEGQEDSDGAHEAHENGDRRRATWSAGPNGMSGSPGSRRMASSNSQRHSWQFEQSGPRSPYINGQQSFGLASPRVASTSTSPPLGSRRKANASAGDPFLSPTITRRQTKRRSNTVTSPSPVLPAKANGDSSDSDEAFSSSDADLDYDASQFAARNKASAPRHRTRLSGQPHSPERPQHVVQPAESQPVAADYAYSASKNRSPIPRSASAFAVPNGTLPATQHGRENSGAMRKASARRPQMPSGSSSPAASTAYSRSRSSGNIVAEHPFSRTSSSGSFSAFPTHAPSPSVQRQQSSLSTKRSNGHLRMRELSGDGVGPSALRARSGSTSAMLPRKRAKSVFVATNLDSNMQPAEKSPRHGLGFGIQPYPPDSAPALSQHRSFSAAQASGSKTSRKRTGSTYSRVDFPRAAALDSPRHAASPDEGLPPASPILQPMPAATSPALNRGRQSQPPPEVDKANSARLPPSISIAAALSSQPRAEAGRPTAPNQDDGPSLQELLSQVDVKGALALVREVQAAGQTQQASSASGPFAVPNGPTFRTQVADSARPTSLASSNRPRPLDFGYTGPADARSFSSGAQSASPGRSSSIAPSAPLLPRSPSPKRATPLSNRLSVQLQPIPSRVDAEEMGEKGQLKPDKGKKRRSLAGLLKPTHDSSNATIDNRKNSDTERRAQLGYGSYLDDSSHLDREALLSRVSPAVRQYIAQVQAELEIRYLAIYIPLSSGEIPPSPAEVARWRYRKDEVCRRNKLVSNSGSNLHGTGPRGVRSSLQSSASSGRGSLSGAARGSDREEQLYDKLRAKGHRHVVWEVYPRDFEDFSRSGGSVLPLGEMAEEPAEGPGIQAEQSSKAGLNKIHGHNETRKGSRIRHEQEASPNSFQSHDSAGSSLQSHHHARLASLNSGHLRAQKGQLAGRTGMPVTPRPMYERGISSDASVPSISSSHVDVAAWPRDSAEHHRKVSSGSLPSGPSLHGFSPASKHSRQSLEQSQEKSLQLQKVANGHRPIPPLSPTSPKALASSYNGPGPSGLSKLSESFNETGRPKSGSHSLPNSPVEVLEKEKLGHRKRMSERLRLVTKGNLMHTSGKGDVGATRARQDGIGSPVMNSDNELPAIYRTSAQNSAGEPVKPTLSRHSSKNSSIVNLSQILGSRRVKGFKTGGNDTDGYRSAETETEGESIPNGSVLFGRKSRWRTSMPALGSPIQTGFPNGDDAVMEELADPTERSSEQPPAKGDDVFDLFRDDIEIEVIDVDDVEFDRATDLLRQLQTSLSKADNLAPHVAPKISKYLREYELQDSQRRSKAQLASLDIEDAPVLPIELGGTGAPTHRSSPEPVTALSSDVEASDGDSSEDPDNLSKGSPPPRYDSIRSRSLTVPTHHRSASTLKAVNRRRTMSTAVSAPRTAHLDRVSQELDSGFNALHGAESEVKQIRHRQDGIRETIQDFLKKADEVSDLMNKDVFQQLRQVEDHYMRLRYRFSETHGYADAAWAALSYVLRIFFWFSWIGVTILRVIKAIVLLPVTIVVYILRCIVR